MGIAILGRRGRLTGWALLVTTLTPKGNARDEDEAYCAKRRAQVAYHERRRVASHLELQKAVSPTQLTDSLRQLAQIELMLYRKHAPLWKTADDYDDLHEGIVYDYHRMKTTLGKIAM